MADYRIQTHEFFLAEKRNSKQNLFAHSFESTLLQHTHKINSDVEKNQNQVWSIYLSTPAI